MRFKILIFISLTLVSKQGINQVKELSPELANKWLVAIEGDTVSAGDFWYVYNKNADPEKIITRDSLMSYRKLYDKFLLKVTEAKSLGYDTTSKFIKEFKGYKNQLADSYLKDKDVTKNLIEEAYERMQTDVEASHILISIPELAMPSDTLAAFKTAMKVKKLAESGGDFKALAKQYSKDPSVTKNGGYLGYFSVFRMVYPFESAAYKTQVGQVSNPFRTRFGYHIIKVHNKRKAVGEIKVAHILTVARDDMSNEKKKEAEKNIFEIYSKLENGQEDFSMLARKFSEDMGTASKGGVLDWFGPSKFVPEFENAAFELEYNGDYSKPVKTVYGWHIIQRIDRREVKSFEESEIDLKTKVARSDRAELSETSVLNKIKKEYKFKEYRKGIDKFFQFCDSTLLTANWKAPEDKKLKAKMFVFNGITYTQKDFAEHLKTTLVPKRGGDYQRMVTYTYNRWIENMLKEFEKSQLPLKKPDYVRLLKEYREGIILFDLSSERVWNKSVTDTAGLRKFHEANSSNWQWDERMDGTVYKCVDIETANLVREFLIKKKDDVYILEKINAKSALNVRVEAGVYQAKDRSDLEGLTFSEGIGEVYKKDDQYIVLKVNKVLPVQDKSLKDVRGSVAAKYQDYLMKEWIEELRAKYKIVYNEAVFNQLAP
ncbi:MAG: peptidylprolyl isomerase [Flavobacteriales bacterium]|nr:peptidylprolyl isomerase [Flavobacteriales bacterium]MBO72877.1 peptidylprolyl isomerase [Flavobacteriales bacterium]|tara:strand:+ start:1433 stop:3403 length:1971 start_codon:yes stop_codon:yes gene_type:complete